ncbi:hypothetical protein QCA50_006605 [Cerrena zonata]|uniref:Protein ROT1 n=1 Tax=Cerrena zonata TaxID=2478898 RepID=A0AAW0GLL3_9APHY
MASCGCEGEAVTARAGKLPKRETKWDVARGELHERPSLANTTKHVPYLPPLPPHLPTPPPSSHTASLPLVCLFHLTPLSLSLYQYNINQRAAAVSDASPPASPFSNVMIFVPLLSLLAAAIVPAAFAQGDITAAHNTTSLEGTWSTGSGAVQTGSGFAQPANKSFTYPKTTGYSFSFTGDGFYEAARYRFTGNGTDPHCITGVMNWHHGHYVLADNGTMFLNPIGDGYQQIQDPCAAESNFIEDYNKTEIYTQWRIFTDVTAGPKLHLFAFDGSPLPPQFQISTTPNMLPTRLLRNVTTAASLTAQNLLASNGALSEGVWSPAILVSVVSSIATIGAATFLL